MLAARAQLAKTAPSVLNLTLQPVLRGQSPHSVLTAMAAGHRDPQNGFKIPAGVAVGDCQHYSYNCRYSPQQSALLGERLADSSFAWMWPWIQ